MFEIPATYLAKPVLYWCRMLVVLDKRGGNIERGTLHAWYHLWIHQYTHVECEGLVAYRKDFRGGYAHTLKVHAEKERLVANILYAMAYVYLFKLTTGCESLLAYGSHVVGNGDAFYGGVLKTLLAYAA